MAEALINVPAKAKRGEIIEIKTLFSHPMETGYRPDAHGRIIPRDIVKQFVCTYDGEVVFSVDMFPAIAANPFFAFSTVATQSGVIAFSWTDDKGKTSVQTAKIEVE